MFLPGMTWLERTLRPRAILLVSGLLACTRGNPAYLADSGPSRDRDARIEDVGQEESLQPEDDQRPEAVDGPLEGDVPNATARLVGYWRFDEGAGATTAADSSGHGHIGVLEGLSPTTSWVPGHQGTALQITITSGSDPGVRVEMTPILAGLQRFTIAAWINHSSTSSAFGSVLSRQLDLDYQEIYNLSLTPTDVVLWVGGRGEGTATVLLPAAGLDGIWVHVAATYDGTHLRLFKDGIEGASLPFTRSLASDTSPLYLGTSKNGTSSEVFVGLLDEVVLYQVALPREAIDSLFKGARPETL